MKKLLLIIILSGSLACFAQHEKINSFIFNVPQIVYIGIDFSHAQVISESPRHKAALEDSLFQKMNLQFLSEQFDWLQDKLSKEIVYDEKTIHLLNSKHSELPLMINNDSIQRIIRDYPVSNNAGTGLVFLVTRLDKHRKDVEMYPIFFDNSSKTIMWMDKEKGTARGGPIGLIHYWYPKVCGTIGNFVSTYKYEKSEYQYQLTHKKKKERPDNIFLKVFVDELCLGYERKLSPVINISLEAGYRQNYINSWHYTGEPLPVEYYYRFLCFNGFTLRAGFDYKISRRSYVGCRIGYQQLYCPKVIWDPGNFGGDDDSEYDVWKEQNNELVLQLIQSIDLGQGSRPVQFFYGIGLKTCYITEYYSYSGSSSYNPYPSDYVVHVRRIQPLITFGLRIRLVSF